MECDNSHPGPWHRSPVCIRSCLPSSFRSCPHVQHPTGPLSPNPGRSTMPPLTLTRRELKVVRDLSEFSKPVKQKKALVTLSQLCIHDPDSRAYIAAAGAIAPLVQLLGAGSSADTQERAATALWHLAKEGNADIIAAAGAIPPLVQLLGHGTPADVQNQACALLATLA